MRVLKLSICMAALAAPLAAHGAAPAATADARCLMTMAAMSSAKDPSMARIGQVGVLYFAGRLKAEDPAFDFATQLKAIGASFNPEILQSEAQRCGPQVVQTLEQLDAAQKSFGPPPSAAKRPVAPKKPASR